MNTLFQCHEPIAESLVMYETGEYQNQFRRSVNTAQASPQLAAEIYDMTQGGTQISSQAVNALSSSVMRLENSIDRNPYTNDGSVVIANGWREERYRFVLTLQVPVGNGSHTVYYYTGYSDHKSGVAINGSIKFDPQMTMTFDKVITTRRTFGHDVNNNPILMENKVAESNFLSVAQACRQGMDYCDNIIAPRNVMAHISTVRTMDAAGIPNHAFRQDNTFMRSKVTLDSACNANPVQTAVKYLKGLAGTKENDMIDGNYGQHSLQAPRTALVQQFDACSLAKDPLISKLGAHNYLQYGFFTWGLMCQMFPNLDNVTVVNHYRPNELGYMSKSAYNECDANNGANLENWIVSTLQNTVSNMMTGSLLKCIRFRFSTKVSGVVNTGQKYMVSVVPYEHTNLSPVQGMVNLPPQMMQEYVDVFLNRFAMEIGAHITNNYLVDMDLIVDCDITGDLQVTLQYGMAPTYYQRLASWASSLTSSLLTVDPNRVQKIGNDLSNLGSMLDDADQYHAPMPVDFNQTFTVQTGMPVSDPFSIQPQGGMGFGNQPQQPQQTNATSDLSNWG